MRLTFLRPGKNHYVHDPREAQSRSENTCVPTLKQRVNHQELFGARSCSVGLSCWVLKTVGKLATSAQTVQSNAPKHLEVTLAYELFHVIWT